MKKRISPYSHTLEILIHTISWAIVFAFPLLFINSTHEYFSWGQYLRHSMVPLSFLIVFYVNYLLLIPDFLFREKTYKYILYNLILLVALGLLLHLFQSSFPPPDIPVDKIRPIRPKWGFFIRDIIGMAFAAGLSAIIRISSRWSQVENARREAEKQRTEAELRSLRNQLNPHFLLNTLNNIYALIAFDASKAQQAVQDLSKLLRHVLYDNQQAFVPLGREVDFIGNYIELMRIRLSSHVVLETHFNIDKDNRTPIAPLIFISLIENAFKHGVSPTEPSRIYISLLEYDKKVICEIINTNYPKNDQDKSGSGVGLAHVDKRLELLYPGRYSWSKYLSEDGKEYTSRLIINTGGEDDLDDVATSS